MSATRAALLRHSRWVIAGLLLYWALSRGQIDVALLKNLLADPIFALGLIGLLFLQLVGNFFRWKLLLKSQEIEVPYRDAFRLGMAAQFFQILGPGTLGADVARSLYISKLAPEKKLRGLSTVLLDRVMGLCGMLILGGFCFLWSLSHLQTSTHRLMPALISLGSLLAILAGLVVVGLLFLPFFVRFLNIAKDGTRRQRLLKIPLLGHLFEIIELYSDRRDYLWAGIGVSVITHCFSLVVVYLLTLNFFGGLQGIEAAEFFLGVSMGQLVVALPLAPSGIGVGQIAFSSVFVTLGWPSESMGGSLITALQILVLLTNLTGVLFVMKREKKS